MPINDFLIEYVALAKRLRELESDLDVTKRRMRELEPLLLEEFGLAGIQNINCDGICVYVRKEWHVNKKSEAEGVTTALLLTRLKANGFSDLCHESYSAPALKSRVLEIIENDDEIPSEVAECLNIQQVLKLVTRKV